MSELNLIYMIFHFSVSIGVTAMIFALFFRVLGYIKYTLINTVTFTLDFVCQGHVTLNMIFYSSVSIESNDFCIVFRILGSPNLNS